VKFPRRRINVDGVSVDDAEARRTLRAAFLEATRQTGISTRRIRVVTMLIGGLLGGLLMLVFLLVPGLQFSNYGWPLLAGAFVLLAVTARITARRILWWMYRHEIRLAMRALGFELCLECGYWLKGLPDDEPRCPECGAERRHHEA